MSTQQFFGRPCLATLIVGAAALIGACSPSSPNPAPTSVTASITSIAPAPSQLPPNLQRAITADLGISPEVYLRRAATANKLAASVTQLRTQDRGVETGWITADGTPVIGVTTDSAQAAVAAAGLHAQPITPIAITTTRWRAAQDWLHEQPDQVRAGIILLWPDYSRGGVNIARDLRAFPFTAPDYPADLLIAERRGIRPTTTGLLPPPPAATSTPAHPGDTFFASATRASRCTLGPLVAGQIITVPHCADGTVALNSTGTVIGEYTTGPTQQTRSIALTAPTNSSVRVDGSLTSTALPSSPIVGAPVCKAGRSSRWQCGVIVGLLPDNGFISTACSLRGDSGGPALQGRAPVGVTDTSSTGDQSQCPATGDNQYLTYTVHRTLSPL